MTHPDKLPSEPDRHANPPDPADNRQKMITGTGDDEAQFVPDPEDLSEDQPGNQLLDTAPSSPETRATETASKLIGQRVGPYELLEVIGEGGMGTIYRARQKEPLQRLVALKLIKAGLDSGQVIARFEAERQALAMMDHPNIARVLDAGTTESGRPFFVMELISGQPLMKYCDDQQFSLRERLELFIPVIRAVQHAHQKGILHRDLKPSNILVGIHDDQPVPKVIDFGISKAIGPAFDEQTMYTRPGDVVGTLEYMSPEQAGSNPLDLDTRCDIYSLGVLLYELLTGETPFDRKRLRSASFYEKVRIICEEEPPKPSTRIKRTSSTSKFAEHRRIPPVRLASRLRGELDWIVMKAMDKERDRRYETALQLANDLQHYLNNEPVSASPPSMTYIARKYLRRHRVGVAVLATVLLLVLGSLSIIIRQRLDSKRQLDLQRAEMLADNLLSGPPEVVPFAIKTIGPLSQLVDELLDSDLRNSPAGSRKSLRAAMFRASLGDVDQHLLLQSTGYAEDSECPNVLTALNQASSFDVGLCKSLAAAAADSRDWRAQSRLSILALYSGHPSIAEEICRPDPNPFQRTNYIATLPEWHSDLVPLVSALDDTDHPLLRYSTLLGVGSIPVARLSEKEIEQWSQLLSDWYINQPDPATHSAANWVLRSWKLDLPPVPRDFDFFDGKKWHLNTNGMTMIRVPAGRFLRRETTSGEMTNRTDKQTVQTITISKPFLLSDREVTVGQFQSFMADSGYPTEGKPQDWPGVESGISPSTEHPAQMVSWIDAVLYCNWLSSSEGLTPCYTSKADGEGGQLTWVSDPGANGYRLPTEAEWEYAARAGADTLYCFGKDNAFVHQWGVLGGRLNAEATGSKMPNAWGFFDMHGNVWEWCSDWFAEYPKSSSLVDPVGPSESEGRVIRGGSFARGPYQSAATHRYVAMYPNKRDSGIGFRVARNCPQPD